MYEITVEQVNAEILRLAEESPDAVYNSEDNRCRYSLGSAGNGEGCIFGQALVNLGVESSVLRDIDTSGSVPTIAHLTRLLDIPFDKEWSSVQDSQDAKETWISSVRRISARKN